MKHSVIIGGTKGLGRVVAQLMAKRGDAVSVIGRGDMPSEDRAAGLIECYKADITDQTGIAETIQKIATHRGTINYLVFLQRYRGQGNDWSGELQTTLTATKYVVEAIAPYMDMEPMADKAIVMVSSVFARYVGDGQAASYHVAKAGLDHLMRFYAFSLGEKGIRCNGVTPSTFLKEESQQFYFQNTKLMKLFMDIIPLRRMGTAEDSANAVLYLCSEQASFITGQNLIIDGGLSLIWQETLARRLMNI